MKVFISWSGDRSLVIAKALRSWLPMVIQSLQPWMSESDIDKGGRWSEDTASELHSAKFGIICLTPENLKEPWILFEAGALSKTLEKTFVCPYLFELEPTDVSWPLAQFQATCAKKEDTKALLNTINGALGPASLASSQLDKQFDKWWPDLNEMLRSIPPQTRIEPQRTDREILEEILELQRAQVLSDQSQSWVKLRDWLAQKPEPQATAAAITMVDILADLKRRNLLYTPKEFAAPKETEPIE